MFNCTLYIIISIYYIKGLKEPCFNNTIANSQLNGIVLT